MGGSHEVPPWPADASPAEVGYEIGCAPTKWFCPSQLFRTGVRAALAVVFGGYSDRREHLAVFDNPVIDDSDQNELWIDFVADTGDGWAATMSVFHLASRKSLDVSVPAGNDSATYETNRGRILVLGGDQVYPTASTRRYENQLVGPLRSTWAWTDGDPPLIVAIPGNHDWYDGLTSFLRVFCQPQWIGARRTRQTRSYFAVKLPHNWWLWGIDVQLDGYIDRSQLEWFQAAARQMPLGASVILAVAQPQWVLASEAGHEDSYATLDFFLRHTVEPAGAEVRLALSGDLHHYSRYRSTEGVELITAGLGGAFLHGTAHLPERLLVPPPESRDPGRSVTKKYVREAVYPAQERSRRLALGVARLPFVNGGLPALVGVVYLLMAAILGMTGARPAVSASDVVSRFGRNPAMWVMGSVVVLGLARFTKTKRTLLSWGIGLAHGTTHFLVGLALAAAVAEGVGERLIGEPRDVVVGLALTAALISGVGGVLGCWVLALWLWLGWRVFALNDNELFAARGSEGNKGFLRLHVDAWGAVTVYPIVIDRICRRSAWRLRPRPPEGGADESWFEPGTPLEPHLAEPPIVVQPAGRARRRCDGAMDATPRSRAATTSKEL